MSEVTFQFQEGDAVYTPEGRGVIINRKDFEDGNRYLVRLVKVFDFLEPDVIENVYHETDLTPCGECDDCIPLTEDFDVGVGE